MKDVITTIYRYVDCYSSSREMGLTRGAGIKLH